MHSYVKLLSPILLGGDLIMKLRITHLMRASIFFSIQDKVHSIMVLEDEYKKRSILT